METFELTLAQIQAIASLGRADFCVTEIDESIFSDDIILTVHKLFEDAFQVTIDPEGVINR